MVFWTLRWEGFLVVPFFFSSFLGCYVDLYLLWSNGGNIGWGDFVVVAMRVLAVGLSDWIGILYNCFNR